MKLIQNSMCLVLVGVALCLATQTAQAVESITADELSLVKQAEEARIAAIDRVYGSVVAIYGPTRQGGGSGVLFDEAGYVLTNHHVVAGAGVAGQGGLADHKTYPWKLVGTDPGGDVAIIKMERNGEFPHSQLGRSDDVRVGDWAMAMGNPFLLAEDQAPTVTLGIVSGVKRYQYGAGQNTLVYGNCIQVDSSINPGNSGGPLYNMRGQVIGINGRGSFKERGRVNVGVGYAISTRQIRNFIPDLMATKLTQHGTLDALFTNRRDIEGNERVLCSTINLDAPARLGLELGDKLVAFEGEPISDANEFTNLISTLPADWPVELTYDREGVTKTIWVRLTALPYGQQQIHPPEEDPPEGEAPKEGERKKPADPKKIRVGKAKPNFGQEGQIRDLKMNRENAAYIVGRWREFSGAATLDQEIVGVQIRDDLMRKDKKIGHAQTTLARDGRFRVAYTEYGVQRVFGFDGKTYWADLADQPPQEATAEQLLQQPLATQALALAEMLRDKPLQSLGEVQIDGGDKSQRRPCYRMSVTKDDATQMYVWLRQFSDDGSTHIELSKTATDINGVSTGVLYCDWQETAGLWLPHTRALADGLDETSVVRLQTVDVETLNQLNDDDFRRPADAE